MYTLAVCFFWSCNSPPVSTKDSGMWLPAAVSDGNPETKDMPSHPDFLGAHFLNRGRTPGFWVTIHVNISGRH